MIGCSGATFIAAIRAYYKRVTGYWNSVFVLNLTQAPITPTLVFHSVSNIAWAMAAVSKLLLQGVFPFLQINLLTGRT